MCLWRRGSPANLTCCSWMNHQPPRPRRRGVVGAMDARAECAMVFITHDRTFLEEPQAHHRTVGGLSRTFKVEGNYTEFPPKEEFLDAQAAEQSALANKVRRDTAWLRQGIKARARPAARTRWKTPKTARRTSRPPPPAMRRKTNRPNYLKPPNEKPSVCWRCIRSPRRWGASRSSTTWIWSSRLVNGLVCWGPTAPARRRCCG